MISSQTLGIVGGGQLGKMIANKAQQFGLKTVILTDQVNSPASFVSNNVVIGNYQDQDILQQFCSQVDFATLEFENIPLSSAQYIAKQKPLFPQPEVLATTQNRILEKNFLNQIKIPTAKYLIINNYQDLENGYLKFGKSILKTATMGYDGKGQFILDSILSCKQAWQYLSDSFGEKILENQLILEQFCNFSCELSVIVAKSLEQIIVYDPLKNIHQRGILWQSHYPSLLPQNLIVQAKEIAIHIAKQLNLTGILAVEFFLVDNQLIVNELAPRPHNSGHFSMDACITCQFEQLIRVILNINLGSTSFHSFGYMQNLLGNQILDIKQFLQNDKAKIHLYGKQKIAEDRKMGHINILNNYE
jgi:5-(carboxyamino)imidazole ribonucleotide synthase